MKKLFKFIVFGFILFNIVSCEQLNDDFTGWVAYWTSVPIITETDISVQDRNDFYCISPEKPEITFSINNPQKISIKTTKDIISFKDSNIPTSIITGIVKSTDNQSLTVKFKQTELEKYEQGNGDLSLTIDLKPENPDDKRKFPDYDLKLKVNTPPPKAEEIVLAKTQEGENLVLCIPFKKTDLTNSTYTNSSGGTEYTHLDIQKLFIEDDEFTLSFNGTTLTKPTNIKFIDASDVQQIGTTPLPDTTSNFVLYYNTGVKIIDLLLPYAVYLQDIAGVNAENCPSPKSDGIPFDGTVNSGDPNAWQKLKAMVEGSGDYARNPPKRIKINGSIVANSNLGNNGFIKVSREVIIEGGSNSNTDILNVDAQNLGSKDRIFWIKLNGKLTISNLKLTGGDLENIPAGETKAGGAVYIDGGTFVMEKSEITDNQSDQGGGGIALNTGTFIMKSGSIYNNTDETKGGGVYLYKGLFDMRGGKIYGNNCFSSAKGKGVYVLNGTFEISGDAKVGTYTNTNGKLKLSDDNAVYLKNGKKITIDKKLTASPASATIEPGNNDGGSIEYKENRPVLAGTAFANDENYKKIKVRDQYNKVPWEITSQGKLHKIGLTSQTITADDNMDWKDLNDAVVNAADGGEIIIEGEIKATSDGGNHFQIEINKDLTIKKSSTTEATINANCINSGKSHRIFIIKDGKTLTIENIKLTGGRTNSPGGAVHIEQNAKLIMNSGEISDNHAGADKGGGVYIAGNGTFEMKAGTITGNTAKKGRGVYMDSNANFSMGTNAKVETNNDVYIISTLGKIKLNGDFTETVARITPSIYNLTQDVLADSNASISNNYGYFTVTPENAGDYRQKYWTIDSSGKLIESNFVDVAYADLETWLSNTASDKSINYINITDITTPGVLSGTSTTDVSTLGQIIKNSNKRVVIQLPQSLSTSTGMMATFLNCKNLVGVVNVPNNISHMTATFKGCTALTHTPYIPNPTSEMIFLFEDCTSLVKAPSLNSNVTNLHWIFNGCTSLTEVPDIPATVTRLNGAFSGCKNLKTIKLLCSCPTASDDQINAFQGCTSLEDGGIEVPNAELGAYKGAASYMGTQANKFSGF